MSRPFPFDPSFALGWKFNICSEAMDVGGWLWMMEPVRTFTLLCWRLETSTRNFSPEVSGAESFMGQILHSSDLLEPELVREHHVVVVGYGKSALDSLQCGLCVFFFVFLFFFLIQLIDVDCICLVTTRYTRLTSVDHLRNSVCQWIVNDWCPILQGVIHHHPSFMMWV